MGGLSVVASQPSLWARIGLNLHINARHCKNAHGYGKLAAPVGIIDFKGVSVGKQTSSNFT